MGNYLIIIVCLLLSSNFYVETITGANIANVNTNVNDETSTTTAKTTTTTTTLGAVNSTKSTRNRQIHNSNNNTNNGTTTTSFKDVATTVLPPVISSSTVRRPSTRQRDNKLMNVLQARRSILNRDRWSSNGKSNATTSANDHPLWDANVAKNSSRRNVGLRDSLGIKVSARNSSSITNNSIVEPVDNNAEYLQMDESIHQAYNISPGPETPTSTSSTTSSTTKEPRSYVNINRTKVRSKPPMTTTKIEFTTIKATRLYYDARQKHNRGKARFMPQKSSYDSELIQFAIYGQKSDVTPKSQLSTSQSRKISRKRGSVPVSSDVVNNNDNKIGDDKLEILDVSVQPRASSTEKARMWQTRFNQVTRNVVAYNNLVRRPPVYSEAMRADATYTIIHPTTLRPRIITASVVASGLNPVNNYIEGAGEAKELFLRSTNVTQLEKAGEGGVVEESSTTTVQPKVPGLIINIPDDATPEGTVSHVVDATSNSNAHVNPVIFYTTTPSTTTSSTTSVRPTPEIVTAINVIEEVEGEEAKVDVLNVPRNSNGRSLNEPSTTTVASTTASTTTTTSTTTSTTPSTTVTSTEPTQDPVVVTKPVTMAPPVTTRSSFVTTTATTSTTVAPPTTTSTTTRFPWPPSTQKYPKRVPTDAPSTSHPPKINNGRAYANNGHPTNNDVTIEIDKMNLATYVMIAIAMVPVLAIILYAIRVIIANHDNKHGLDMIDGQPISPVVKLDSDTTSNSTDESVLGHDTMMFNRNNLRFKSLLGEGNFGQVWKAEVDDERGHLQGTTRVVAVKTERRDNGQGGLKVEAEIMRKLGSSHQNVVKLLGACTEQEPHLIIMEYAMRGRLLSLLRAAKGGRNSLPQTLPTRPAVMPLSPRRLTGFALDIAKGMEFIASKKIVHRDLAARNVLLDHNGICKICDFGMSIDLGKADESHAIPKIPRVHSESRFKFDLANRAFNGAARHWDAWIHHGDNNKQENNKNSRPALPIRWMAPEALQYHIYSTKTDVFAFGIVLWEIATLGCTPYPNLSGREVIRNIPNGTRPEIPLDCRQELYDLMNRTWQKDPNQRLSFTEARQILHRTVCQWQCDDTSDASEYMDVSGFSEDLEHGMVYFNRRVSEFECEI